MERNFGNPSIILAEAHKARMSNDLIGKDAWTVRAARIQEIQDAHNS